MSTLAWLLFLEGLLLVVTAQPGQENLKKIRNEVPLEKRPMTDTAVGEDMRLKQLVPFKSNQDMLTENITETEQRLQPDKLPQESRPVVLDGFECPETFGRFPVFNRCNSFVECNSWEPREMNCSDNLHYNMVKKQCDFPKDAQCPYVCPSNNGRFPMIGVCSAYIECASGAPMLRTCDPGQHWNRHKEQCQDHVEAGCLLRTEQRLQPEKLLQESRPAVLDGFECPETFGRFPVFNKCNSFIECNSWEPRVMNCYDNLHYNMVTKECDFPEDAQCPYVCPSNNGRFPMIGVCSAYIECTSGAPMLRMCDPGLHWNRHREQCQDRVEAGCLLRCPQENGTFAILDDCSLYILCEQGIPHLKKCPQGLFFGFGSLTCEPNHPGLCPMDFQCPEHTSRAPVLGSCHMFLQCTKMGGINDSSDVVLVRVCPDGLLYNHDTELCDEPRNVICADQCPQENGIFEIAGLCNFYKICTDGVASLHTCPSGLHFDTIAQHCDHPERAGCVTKCSQVDKVTSVPGRCRRYAVCKDGEAEINPCPAKLQWNQLLKKCDSPASSNCKPTCPKKFGLFPIPGRCEDYTLCTDGKPSLQRCPEGLHFHPRIRMCVIADDTQCILHCPQPNGIFPVDGDCSAFISCSHNVPTVGSCDEDHHFNAVTTHCDLSYNVTCNSQCPQPDGRFSLPGYSSETFMECYNNSSELLSCSQGLKLDSLTETCGH